MKKRYITKLPDGRKKQYAILLGRRKLLTHGKIVEESLLTKTYRSYFIPENFVEEEAPANNMNGGIVNGAVGIKGDKGDKGEKGERGLQGERGEKGEKGDRGERGLKGEKGDRGEQGIQGERGLQGERGERGSQGLQGIQGERGLQGERGERGLQGIQGEKGEKGDPGERGEQGLQGEKGDKGERGLQGERGEKGEKGDRGEKGSKGDRGEQGFQGEKGEKGDRGEQGIQGERGERGLKGEKGEKGDPGERGADAVLPNFKTINGQSLIGEGDISPVTEEVKEEIRRAVNADILPNLETIGQALERIDAADKEFRNTVLTDVRTWITDLQTNAADLNTKMGKLLTVFPESYLDTLIRWTMAQETHWSNVFGGTSVANLDKIRFNNQKSCFLAPENVTGIKFKLRAPNNPGGYILWVITSVNRNDQSDVRAFTMDFQTYIQETYTSWIKPREGHTAYNGRHGATAQNIKDVFNVHNVEIQVIDNGDKIVCSNALGFSFEVPKFSGQNFITRFGIGSQANFSNNVEAYDISFFFPAEESTEQSSSENSNQTS